MMGNMGGGVQDPKKMEEMMKNPSISNLLSSPDFLESSVNMLK
jgi:hypothetical protein